MNLSDVLSKAKKRPARKRRGRGQGSGMGKTSSRGSKGAASRSGWSRRFAYDGGGTSLIRRLPKRGFSNSLFSRKYDLVNLETLEASFEPGDTVNLEVLVERRILSLVHGRLKVLARGDINKKLTVVADAASAAARQKIEAVGGKLEGLKPPKKKKRPSGGTAAEKGAAVAVIAREAKAAAKEAKREAKRAAKAEGGDGDGDGGGKAGAVKKNKSADKGKAKPVKGRKNP